MEGNLTLLNFLFLIGFIAIITIVIWAPRRFYVKMVSLALALSLMGLSYLSLVDLLGRPKPIALEWTHDELKEAVVRLEPKVVEGKGIYLLIDIPGKEEPVYYVLPWKEGEENQEGSDGDDGENDAEKGPGEQLQDALEKLKEEDGAELLIANPFQGSLETRERKEKYYLKLPPKPRPKDSPEEGPEIFEHPGTEF